MNSRTILEALRALDTAHKLLQDDKHGMEAMDCFIAHMHLREELEALMPKPLPVTIHKLDRVPS